MDKNNDGYVTACDPQRFLQEFNYHPDHDQFSSLLNRCVCTSLYLVLSILEALTKLMERTPCLKLHMGEKCF